MKAKRRGGGFTLIELLIVIIIIGILIAIAIPMYLGQKDKAKEAVVKGGVHEIELGLGSYAIDNADRYPATGAVSRASMVDSHGVPYVDNWPQNPWTNVDMAQGATKGNYAYTQLAGGNEFRLVGYGRNDAPVITAP